jgi:DNA modification methylase
MNGLINFLQNKDDSMKTIYFKLRANIELDGDINIAKREIAYFCETYQEVTREKIVELQKQIKISENDFLSNIRNGEVIGFIGITKYDIRDILIKTSFVQEIWVEDIVDTSLKSKPFCELAKCNYYCLIPLFPMSEFLTFYKKNAISSFDIQLFTKHLANTYPNLNVEKVVRKSSTSTPHAHGLHKYKAKFFPRLIRTFLLTESNHNDNAIVLDPFVGSGTALVESSFLGFDSIGVDIDKLSCLISESKSKLLSYSQKEINEEMEAYFQKDGRKTEKYKFPSWISKKFDRWGTPEERNQYENEISEITAGLANLNGSTKLFQTAISDAVSRKFNIRMMGTGVGRFALEIQKSSLEKIVRDNILFLKKATNIIDILKTVYEIKLPVPKVINGDATDLSSIPENTIDLILTSPPYLPASSGREDYLIGKSVSITALNLMNEEQIKQAETNSVGSMKNQTMLIEDGLPDAVYKLYTFLKNDPLRNIKAEPTYTYYQDIKKSLLESYRVLKPQGKAIYVIGKESVFYTFKTREVLYKVECDSIFKDIANSVGFNVKEVADIELNKKNKNARPRALDKYYESVFVVEK